MTGALTQKQRVLRALRRTGQRGVTAVDFLAPAVIDDGSPILRVPARVEELRRDGHPIQIAGRRNDCVIYILAPTIEEGSVQLSPEPADESIAAVVSLFDADIARPEPASPYDTGGEAA